MDIIHFTLKSKVNSSTTLLLHIFLGQTWGL